MSKKRQHILTYHAGRRGWVKKYRGKQHWVLYASRKSDRDKYREAVLVWNRMKAEIDAGEYERVKSERAAARSTSSAAAVPRTNPRQVSTAVTRFLRQKQVEVNGGQISVSRLKGLEYGLSRFGESFGRRSLGELNEKQIEDFRCEQLTRIATGEIKPSTLDQQFRSVRQFLRWCWKQRLLRDLPRNLDDLRVKIPRAEIEVFTPQEVKDLWSGIGSSNLHPRWRSRAGVDADQEILRAMLLLGLNGGYTQMDLATLRVRECRLAKRPPVISKRRSKTGVQMRHSLWTETRALLSTHCEGKRPGELVFTRPSGAPILSLGVDAHGNRTGGRSDWIGDKFKRLVQRVLGPGDTRRVRVLRKTGADFIKQRVPGLERLYLGHQDNSMSAHYAKPANAKLDEYLRYMEGEFGFRRKSNGPKRSIR